MYFSKEIAMERSQTVTKR